ncbi:4'-phosphopantetheinyl transferase family protein [Szabonella alba]|uniref:Enterobactin synthase component D n=1 Tax=Szabonella alba TaxID=2804194 RepID=A0A8K0VAX0_9RHOB|nr:4'-phosphopantetheinyl transferase superfamily protein [Szabonella alba]MBL4915897.1 4'-phosphopantetheinyl transferase superfamily protein [Szabonella alba]
MPDLTALAAAVSALLPPGCALAAADPGQEASGLLPGEAISATETRLREFAAGRRAARQAMAALGLASAAIPMGRDRAPLWPGGIVGSISHSATACLAVVTTRPLLLGLDLEPEADLARDLWPMVLRDEEAARTPDPRHAMAVFCAKEAAYKAQYPRTRHLFDFQTLEISLSDDRFTACFRAAVPGFALGSMLEGRIIRAAGHIAALVATDQPVSA